MRSRLFTVTALSALVGAGLVCTAPSSGAANPLFPTPATITSVVLGTTSPLAPSTIRFGGLTSGINAESVQLIAAADKSVVPTVQQCSPGSCEQGPVLSMTIAPVSPLTPGAIYLLRARRPFVAAPWHSDAFKGFRQATESIRISPPRDLISAGDPISLLSRAVAVGGRPVDRPDLRLGVRYEGESRFSTVKVTADGAGFNRTTFKPATSFEWFALAVGNDNVIQARSAVSMVTVRPITASLRVSPGRSTVARGTNMDLLARALTAEGLGVPNAAIRYGVRLAGERAFRSVRQVVSDPKGLSVLPYRATRTFEWFAQALSPTGVVQAQSAVARTTVR